MNAQLNLPPTWMAAPIVDCNGCLTRDNPDPSLSLSRFWNDLWGRRSNSLEMKSRCQVSLQSDERLDSGHNSLPIAHLRSGVMCWRGGGYDKLLERSCNKPQ
jgi:hypothetical protein